MQLLDFDVDLFVILFFICCSGDLKENFVLGNRENGMIGKGKSLSYQRLCKMSLERESMGEQASDV